MHKGGWALVRKHVLLTSTDLVLVVLGSGRDRNRWVRGEWLCQFSFILSVFSASYPKSSGDAGEFYRTL